MNDKDLVMRGDVENARTEILRTLNYINLNGALYYTVYIELFDEIKRQFDGIHSIPQEMSAREYARTRNRMCLSYLPFCNGCTVLPERMECGEVIHDCPLWTLRDPEKAVAIVEKWAREHPEEAADE